MVLSSGAPKKTFIASYGAEAHGDADTFNTLEPQPKDVVHISGNTLMDHTATGVDGFLLKAGTDPAARDYTLVINPTNTLRALRLQQRRQRGGGHALLQPVPKDGFCRHA